MLIRKLGILPLSLLLFAGASYAAPVDLTGSGPIFLHSETTTCDISVRPNQTGCTVTSSNPAAVFGAPLSATLTQLGGGQAEVRIDASVWDPALKATLNNPAGGIIYEDGSASDYVLVINSSTGAAISWGWTATIFSTALASDIGLSAALFGTGGAAGGAEAYGAQLTGPTSTPVAAVCGSGGISGGPIAGECNGTRRVANELYDPATGFAHFAASSVIVPALFPLAWAPVDIALTTNGVIPEPGTVLLLGAGLLGLATVGRKRS